MTSAKKVVGIVVGALAVCALVAGAYFFGRQSVLPEPPSAESNLLTELERFTSISNNYSYVGWEDDKIVEDWDLCFYPMNSVVRFNDPDLYVKIDAVFGEGTVEEGRAIYAYPDNRYSIYFKDEVMDGISTISYFPDENTFEAFRSSGNEDAELPEGLQQTIEDSGIFEQMIKNNAEVTATLKERGIDVSLLKTTRVTDYNPAAQ